MRDVKFGIICSCAGDLCNEESESLILNDYLVVRELYFDKLFDIAEDASPVGGAMVSLKAKMIAALFGRRGRSSSSSTLSATRFPLQLRVGLATVGVLLLTARRDAAGVTWSKATLIFNR